MESIVDISVRKDDVLSDFFEAILKSAKPSIFFENLKNTGKLSEYFPEVSSLIGIPQNPVYHPEGDVWNHTMLVLDKAAEYRSIVAYPKGFMLTALTHDFGKIICTEEINGVIHAYGHETKGLPLISGFLEQITNDRYLIKYVLNMCEFHMKPNILAGVRASVKSTNRMFDSVEEPLGLIYIAAADNAGKDDEERTRTNMDFLMSRLNIYNEIMSRPYVMESDLVEAGLGQDEKFSYILNYAHKLRLAGVNKESALKQALAYARKL